MQDILLSIIVPVYNVEPFLRKCVHSLEQQDLAPERYEVILVNDAPPIIVVSYVRNSPSSMRILRLSSRRTRA